MINNYFKKGSWNVQCDICGIKAKREQIKKRWDGFMCCTINNCYDRKHPFETPVRQRKESLPVPDARPRQADQFVSISGLSTWINILPLPKEPGTDADGNPLAPTGETLQPTNGTILWSAAHIKWKNI